MTTQVTGAPPPKPTDASKPERRWAPRFWVGCNFSGLVRLLIHNRFAVGPRHSYIVAVDLLASLFNSCLGAVQTLVYRRRLRDLKLEHPPIFIIGHWRSGTTLLHELLILDPRHTFPTTYQCFAPNHFLLTERLLSRWLRFLMPTRRPMDNMAAGWDRPQEDEFALCNLGVPSPYWTIAFPNRPPQCQQYYSLEQVPPAKRERWKQALSGFIKAVSYKTPGKSAVLKSPPHTCRIKILLELYPDAKFIHIVRDPFELYSSTIKLWKALYASHGFQTPRYEGLERYVLDTFAMMHEQLTATRDLVRPSHFHQMRFEELTRDPVERISQIYQHLNLGDFEPARPAVEAYVALTAKYQKNEHHLPSEVRTRVVQAWRDYFERYGYSSRNGEGGMGTGE